MHGENLRKFTETDARPRARVIHLFYSGQAYSTLLPPAVDAGFFFNRPFHEGSKVESPRAVTSVFECA
jgi:hypothetical protein